MTIQVSEAKIIRIHLLYVPIYREESEILSVYNGIHVMYTQKSKHKKRQKNGLKPISRPTLEFRTGLGQAQEFEFGQKPKCDISSSFYLLLCLINSFVFLIII